ncbi:uncharacterized protein B0H18DRAFT_1116880 [Fomitopsis serialis]|uniref:uncharacterized protein n=1 Tax=Fomitopsis serialis TaxID=139415 RepID=UPI0020077A72|nr:uncharacterized protein B0H18DRAFT_1116880 [Neoantrodia serialis]KAH9930769.1 hypothetical protein B0H18DRAFT_1116880 [Neoantrodia serialis]
MSLAKLTLRPPPNIDFVQGYPGIPPGGADRNRGARGGQGVKAKWVRIELKKVEVLPGGGTFYDYVGQSPINVWQASEEYGMLHTQDFPFYIRIPESIPPSIALEKGAGIRYELIAAVCLKGKRGLLRRDKPTITTASSTIIIDKHELHSTWPIYQQPETRSHVQGDVTLIVERGRTCFGPGDRIAVSATVKADNMHKDTLRGFELTLRETTVYRGGPHTTGKKGAPVIKVVHIAEQRVPLNAALFGGMQHKADLFVTVPAQHTSTTLNTARHIDITYHLVVKALMATTQHVSFDLPVLVSNWPRAVSIEAMRRIGLAPNVSTPGRPAPAASAVTSSSASSVPLIGQPIIKNQARPSTAQSTDSQVDVVISRPSVGQYNTAPAERSNGNAVAGKPDEFGVTAKAVAKDQESNVNSPERSQSYGAQTIGGTPGLGGSGSGSGLGRIAPYASETTAFARPRAGSAKAGSQRFTVTNLNEAELAEHRAAERASASRAQGSTAAAERPSTASSQNTTRSRWLTAEEEKRRLYERAVANVERVQGVPVPRPLSPVGSVQDSVAPSTPAPDTVSLPVPNPATQTPAPKPKAKRWLTAEEEKARLFENAQAAVARAQGLDGSVTSSPPASIHNRSESVASNSPMSSPSMRAQIEPTAGPAPHTPPPAQGSSGGYHASPPSSVRGRMPTYMSAEEEKIAMRRFYEAKAAVDRTQETAFGVSPSTPAAPLPYDALYPSQPTSPPTVGDSSPPSAPSSSQPAYLSEKERLRRDYEARDAAAMASPPAPPPHALPPMSAVGSPAYQPVAPVTATPLSIPAASSAMSSAAAEKEMLRRRFEAQDAALASNGAPTPPPRSGSFSAGAGSRAMPTPPRPHAVPPVSGSGSRPLTAAEEKARLKAMYEVEDPVTKPPNGVALPPVPSATPPLVNGAGRYAAPVTPPPPPPLAPKPPKEYIQETQEEDMRTHARLQAIDKEISGGAPLKAEVILSSFSADLVDANGNPIPSPGPPPPLAQPTNSPVTIE